VSPAARIVLAMDEAREVEIAEWVERFVREHLGEAPGPRCRQNGERDPDLTVDFTYEDAMPPFALEITSITDHFDEPDVRHVRSFRRRLNREAAKLGWPHWVVGLRTETKLSSGLAPSVVTVMGFAVELGVPELGTASYPRDLGADLASRLTAEFYEGVRQARLHGVISVARTDSGGVRTIRVEEFSDSRSLGRPLERAMAAKGMRLGRAKRRGYWTMLAIDVTRTDAERYLMGYRLPGVPKGIDHVWLFVGQRPGGPLRAAFYANREERRLVQVA